jgi:hypothetical protein
MDVVAVIGAHASSSTAPMSIARPALWLERLPSTV